jgi:hypothetical protein
MAAQRPVGGKVAVELAREAALCEAARATALLSRTEPRRDASARRGFSRPGPASQACRQGCGGVAVIRPRDDVTPVSAVAPRIWSPGARGCTSTSSTSSRSCTRMAARCRRERQSGSVQGRGAAIWPAGWPLSSALAGAVPVMRPLTRKETAGGWLRQAAGPGEWPRSLRACGLPVAGRPWCRPGHADGQSRAAEHGAPVRHHGQSSAAAR